MTAPVAATSRTPIAREFRAAKAALGLRQAQIWVPDTRSPAYIAECKRIVGAYRIRASRMGTRGRARQNE
ncbi:antitoxin MazE-like protein [Cupriavidus plantarum]|uniref:antitoxin MazE-like protein n=1 Tax=Cupriavidus plantarum TaxID=942865 RepID=UPI0015FFC059